ncbi:MAG: hypothetical protein CME65_09630 [Halobacteriovoraceae bacterium]|nr:hypothetical protein [Halobacteriovoraceae bacterium]|tara:strand:- start:3809 stop:5434 length:1626 start_codon:yes stop_codon:yes gene_type:complete
MSKKLHLRKLTIQNLGIIDQQIVHFSPKFNAIIGETGSGKSLILDAIELIIGFRGDKKLLRKGSDFLMVEGLFSTTDAKIKKFFEDAGYPFDEDCSIKRILYSNGKSKTYVNQQLSTQQFVKTFARKYIDLVGQFENQKLLSPEYQLKLLDLYGQNGLLLTEYRDLFLQIKEQRQELEELTQKENTLVQKRDYLEFQVNQLDKLSPSVSKEQELIKQKEEIKTKLESREVLNQINELFEGNNYGAGLLGQLDTLEGLISKADLSEKDTDHFLSAKELLQDLNFRINLEQNTEFPEDEYQEIVDSLDEYQKQKRKFNTDTQGLERVFADFKKELSEIETIDQAIESLEIELEKKYKKAQELAGKLHKNRLTSSKKLSQSLTEMIKSLRMEGAKIKVNISQASDLNINGHSTVEFLAETNPGEGFYAIKDIASGGELSRILLAVRNILAAKDSISIFLFDEIDTGIGGETALCVGNAIESVSVNSQVITITHLPQIAKFADKIIKVEKSSKASAKGNERTIAAIFELEGQRMDHEVQSMIPLN